MPRLSTIMVRTALLYLGLGFTFGALLLWNKGLPFAPQVWALLPMHIEFLLFGWIAHLAMGVAFWILPRFSREPRRGRESLMWFAFAALNVGIWSVGVGALLSAPAAVGLGRAAQISAAVLFAFNAWPRVKALGAN